MRQAESSKDTVQRQKNSCLRDAFVFYAYNTYIVHDGSPSLHRNALKHCEHGEEDVVEADDAELGSLPAGLALRPAGITDEAAAADAGTDVSAPLRTRRQLLLAHQVPFA